MPFRKNVFIVGAGFSAEAGTPVVQNFFEKAMELWKDPASFLSADERPIFEQVFNYRQSLEGAESRVGIDLDNIEDLFGTVEMASQLGIGDAHTTRKNLVYVILRTLELSATKKVRGFAYTHQAGAGTGTASLDVDLYEFFLSVVAGRWFPLSVDGIARDAIISLNYDLLLEHPMEHPPIEPLYDLPTDLVIHTPWSESTSCRIRLLKLHGSANWVVCPACRSRIYVLKPSQASVARSEDLPTCHVCKQVASARLVVPPTWNKEEYRPLLNSVWQSAARELAIAQRIVVIGYSMPETDKFFQYLLAVSLASNRLLDEVVVVNRDSKDCERIAKLFRRHYERHRSFRVQNEFRQWTSDKNFQNQLRQVFPAGKFAW